MTQTSSLDPDIHMAIALVFRLEPVIDRLIGYSNSLPNGVEKGSQAHKEAIHSIGVRFLPDQDPEAWEPPSEPVQMPAVSLTTKEILTVIHALHEVNSADVAEHLEQRIDMVKVGGQTFDGFVNEIMARIAKARAIYRYEEDDEIVGIKD